MITNPSEVANYLEGNYQLQQNGIDLKIEKIERIVGVGRIYKDKTDLSDIKYKTIDTSNDLWRLDGGFAYKLTFSSSIKVPEDKMGVIIHRSSLARCGAFIFSGIYDSGFEGQLGAFLHTTNSLVIEKDARLAQLIITEASSRELYKGQYQNT